MYRSKGLRTGEEVIDLLTDFAILAEFCDQQFEIFKKFKMCYPASTVQQ
jgi:hypothetical protein